MPCGMRYILKNLLSLSLFFLSSQVGFTQLRSTKIVDSISRFTYLEFCQNTIKADLPVLIHLHGKRGRGNGDIEGLKKMENNSPIRYLVDNKRPVDYPFLILAPQLPAKTPSWEPELVDQFISYVIEKYKVDESRIYLTGISMGGNGVWKYAYSAFNSPNKLAAISPIAAWGNEQKACAIVKREIPIWAFHGEMDQTVEFNRGLKMYEALARCNNALNREKYKFTAYEKAKHNSWSRAYLPSRDENKNDLYKWLLNNRLQTKKIKKEPKVATASKNNESELTLIQKLPLSLKESSGLIVGSEGDLWLHNDSGNGPFLLKYDTTNKTSFLKKITYASNVDWEDITKDDEGNFYIGDIGNNENLRKELQVYKISKPDTISTRQSAEKITFYYEDQIEFPPPVQEMNFDAEAIIHWEDHLYIFSKNRTEPFTGYSKIYKIPTIPGRHKAILYDSIMIGTSSIIENQVTGASVSPDRKHLVLLTYNKVLIISCFTNDKFSSGNITGVPLGMLSQKEAIDFVNNSEVLITDELFRNFIGGNLYKINLAPWLPKDCE